MNSIMLIKLVRDCTLCIPHLPLGARPVFQVHPKARILIAGQAPGRKVHETGIPFNDPSGQRLREWMGIGAEIFYNPEIISILPMGFCYPGSGKSGDLPPRPECANQWRTQLLALMPDIQLTLVIGQYAQQWHLGESKKSNLTKTVEAWKEYWPDVLPLPHPSPRNNLWLKKNPWFENEVTPVLKQKIDQIIKR
jgi:uracil-DNA glycosylase